MTPIDVALIFAWALVAVEAVRLLWVIFGTNIRWKGTLFQRWCWGLVFDLTCKEAKASKGTCCCGSPVDRHGWGDGHSPVDMYHFHKDRYIDKRMRK